MPMGPPFHLSLPTIQAIVAVGDRPAEQRSVVRRFGRAVLDKIVEGLSHAQPGPADMVGPLFGAPAARPQPEKDSTESDASLQANSLEGSHQDQPAPGMRRRTP